MTVNVTFQEAAEGVVKEVLVKKKTRCGECEGSRCLRGTLPQRCWTCHGKGVEVLKTGPDLEETPCKSCRGAGITVRLKCPVCVGQGVVLSNAVEKLKIPQFVDDGDTFKFEHHGHEAPDSYNGDLHLTVFVEEHPNFSRDGNDLIVTVPISYSTSVLGGTVVVPQLHGPDLQVSLSQVSHDARVVLEGQGLHNRKTGKTGKQVIVFQVIQGQGISGDELRLFQQLRDAGL